MLTRRAALLITMLVVPGSLWAFLNAAKNDLVHLNRSLIQQVQAAYRRYDETEDKIAANERLGRVSSRFYLRYRFPEGDAEQQMEMFDRLFVRFRDCDPETVEYGPDRSPRKSPDGRELAHVQTVMRGRTEDDEPMRLSVEWVQFKGSWYIDDYSIE